MADKMKTGPLEEELAEAALKKLALMELVEEAVRKEYELMEMEPLEEELMEVALIRPVLMELAEEEEEAVLKEYEVLMEP